MVWSTLLAWVLPTVTLLTTASRAKSLALPAAFCALPAVRSAAPSASSWGLPTMLPRPFIKAPLTRWAIPLMRSAPRLASEAAPRRADRQSKHRSPLRSGTQAKNVSWRQSPFHPARNDKVIRLSLADGDGRMLRRFRWAESGTTYSPESLDHSGPYGIDPPYLRHISQWFFTMSAPSLTRPQYRARDNSGQENKTRDDWTEAPILAWASVFPASKDSALVIARCFPSLPRVAVIV